MKKSVIACRWTLQSMPDRVGVWMWTLTKWTCQDLEFEAGQWSIVARRLRRMGITLVRVFEFHPKDRGAGLGGWGLHVHFVVNRVVHHSRIQEATAGTIFSGRWSVKKLPREHRDYPGKNTGRGRPESAKGRRMWSVVGRSRVFDGSTVRSARISNLRCRAFHWEVYQVRDLQGVGALAELMRQTYRSAYGVACTAGLTGKRARAAAFHASQQVKIAFALGGHSCITLNQ